MRVAVVGGCRSAFVKAGGALAEHSYIDLAIPVVKGALARTGVEPGTIDEFVFSTVLVDTRAPNFAREIIFRAGLPKHIVAHSVSNNCISGLVALSHIADAIGVGRIACGMAGGSESMSRPALAFHPSAEKWFLKLSRARTFGEKAAHLAAYRPRFGFPVPPSPKEPSTGLTMGQHCEITAKEFSIAREAQDNVAFKSHQNAARAKKAGYLGEEIEPINGVGADNLIREDTTLEKLAKLQPVFDRSGKGTLTAGNSSALTDGASALILMSEDRARQERRPILGFIRDIQFTAIDPNLGLLMAPTTAVPRVLQRTNLKIDEIDLFEVHEAFAAQVLANRKVWKEGWNKLPEARAIGDIPEEKLNVNGGSIALGHPFAATGGRLVLSALNELRRRNQRRALISVCAAGAMAAAVIVESASA